MTENQKLRGSEIKEAQPEKTNHNGIKVIENENTLVNLFGN